MLIIIILRNHVMTKGAASSNSGNHFVSNLPRTLPGSSSQPVRGTGTFNFTGRPAVVGQCSVSVTSVNRAGPDRGAVHI